jgi:hypothetical protein
VPFTALISGGYSYAQGANGINVSLGGWTPGWSVLPINYTNINTDTDIVSGH